MAIANRPIAVLKFFHMGDLIAVAAGLSLFIRGFYAGTGT